MFVPDCSNTVQSLSSKDAVDDGVTLFYDCIS